MDSYSYYDLMQDIGIVRL